MVDRLEGFSGCRFGDLGVQLVAYNDIFAYILIFIVADTLYHLALPARLGHLTTVLSFEVFSTTFFAEGSASNQS